jgi:uncharacterized membrane-anchored protein
VQRDRGCHNPQYIGHCFEHRPAIRAGVQRLPVSFIVTPCNHLFTPRLVSQIMVSLLSHPQRAALHDEIHQRPSLPVPTPARVSSLTLHGASPAQYREFFNALLRAFQQRELPETALHWQQELDGFALRWSLHNEFARLTLMQPQAATDFTETALALLPESARSQLPGHVIYAVHALVLAPEQAPNDLPQLSRQWFSGHALIGAQVAQGKLILLSDLQRHPDPLIEDGATRLLMINTGAGKHSSGRMLHYFSEMESYRLMGLLSFPLAKHWLPEVAVMENRLQAITRSIADGDDPEASQASLNEVAEALEDAIASSHFRFSATRAYAAMMERRLRNLHEKPIEGVVPFTEFMERRILPAFATVESVRNRLQELSTHLQRTAELLRTRIEMNLLKQNQSLLVALNRRAALQLRLQQTVEGLSVGVLGYYAVSLLHYLLEGLEHAGVAIDVPLATAAAVPVVLAVLLWRLRRLRRHFAHIE